MRYRWLTYLTVTFTLLLPLLGVLWGRSYLADEVLYGVGRGRTMMLSCIRGELALWSGPARSQGPMRFGYDSSQSGHTLRATELLAQDHTAQQHWLLGFGYAQSYALAPSDLGPVRCVVVPLWSLILLAAVLPARVLLRQVHRNRASAEAELARCRRCGADLAPGETHCAACRFPAFVRRSVVA